ncbi:hypothetical protein [Bacillus thuringiensis]|uniref:Uncharacterized protein n=1 Tax=Bacillus thuringiensis TaxID=1428 RepID=A0A9X6WSG2_BACTU|nr:hypothetical protein [Bacillus thuringiensis]PFJ42764.1 hypothetical protein COJ15_05330 [Bacillus thuringiensis]
MDFVTKPKSYDINKVREFEKFKGFGLAITNRNWSGQDYATSEDGKRFLKELRECEEQFWKLTPGINEGLNLDFLIDVSVFKNVIPDNGQLIELLEEIEDFYDVDINDKEKNKLVKKYQKKLKSYSTKLENMAYLYRWYFTNKNHPFSEELKHNMDNLLIQLGKKTERAVGAHEHEVFGTLALSQAIREMEKSNSVNNLGEDELEELFPGEIESLNRENQGVLANELFMKSVVPTNDCFSKLFKYGFDEPSLFFYGLYAIGKYLEGHARFTKKMRTFILIEPKNNNVDIFLTYSSAQLAQKFLSNEFLFKEFKRLGITHAAHDSFINLENSVKLYEKEKIKTFKRLAKDIAGKIKEDEINKNIFKKSWFHKLPDEFEDMFGISVITLREISTIAGPNGPEIFIKGTAYTINGNPYFFSIFNPTTWGGFSSTHCAIMTYSIHLLYALMKEDNFEIIPNKHKEKKQPEKILNNKMLKNRLKASAAKRKAAASRYKENVPTEILLWFREAENPFFESNTMELHVKNIFEHEIILKDVLFDCDRLEEEWKTKENSVS